MHTPWRKNWLWLWSTMELYLRGHLNLLITVRFMPQLFLPLIFFVRYVRLLLLLPQGNLAVRKWITLFAKHITCTRVCHSGTGAKSLKWRLQYMDTYFVMIAFLHHKPNYVKKKKRKLGVHNIGFFYRYEDIFLLILVNCQCRHKYMHIFLWNWLQRTSSLFCSGTITMCLILLSWWERRTDDKQSV